MQGRRVEFIPGFPGDWAQPGDYCKVPEDVPFGRRILYMVMDPTGGVGSVIPENHQVTEHDDGTITITPSLVMPGDGWHGWHGRGVWRSV